MNKNVAGQKVGAQLVSATDGSAFTGSVTVSVTVDAGTQATGSVGSGACTHEGNGYHTYAPAQAETNGDLVAFTFTGSGAVPVTVQIYTRPATGLLAPATAGRTLVVDAAGLADANVVKLGPSGSGTAQTARDIGASVLVSSGTGTGQISLTSGVAAVNVTQFGGTNGTFSGGRPEVNATHWGGTAVASANVLIDGAITAAKIASDAITAAKLHSDVTTELQAGLATASALTTVAEYLDTEIASILADTNELQTDWADGGRLDLILDDTLDSIGNTFTAVDGMASDVTTILADTNELQTDWANGGRLDLILDARASQTSVDDVPTNSELATALAAADDAVLAAIAALNNLSAAQVNAEVVDVLRTDTVSELSAVPAASPNLHAMIQWLYMASRNKIDVTASALEIHNDAGTVIGTKNLSDDGTTYSESEAS